MERDVRARRSFLLPILLLYLLHIAGVPIFILALIAIWYTAILRLESMGSLDRMDATRVLGIILMLRTRRGKGILDAISSHKRFWRCFGEFSIWLCLVVMAGVILLLFASAYSTAQSPPEDYLPASDLLLIPGVTSFVPFWWPALALIVALVIHEYSHGIQARAHGMRLRSFGLLLVGPIPIGAFAEPEEEEMNRAPRRDRMRLFAAGPSINILATYVVLILLSAVSSGMVAENEGVHARGIVQGGAAEGAGLLPYEIITHMNGVEVPDGDAFSIQMEEFAAGDQVAITVLSDPSLDGVREERTIELTLGDRYQFHIGLCEEDQVCEDETGELLEELGIEPGDGFLGVSQLSSGTAGVDGFSFIVEGEYSFGVTAFVALIEPLIMLQTPISLDGQTMILEERAMLEAGSGFLGAAIGTEGTLMLFDFLFWLVWINFLLGFANLIPMIPFDGGHLVRDGVHSALTWLKTGMHPMKIEQLANRISSMSSFFILFILAIPVIIPRIF